MKQLAKDTFASIVFGMLLWSAILWISIFNSPAAIA